MALLGTRQVYFHYRRERELIVMSTFPALLLQDSGASGGLIGGSMFMLVVMALVVIAIVGMWKVFTKAGQPGWACIVPIYNLYVLLQIAGKPAWWIVLFLIPLVNIIAGLLLAIEVAKSFGQSAGWGIIMLFLLSGIGYMVLGFGNYRYVGPGGNMIRANAAAG